jgi:hypothetical protein
MWPFRKKEYDFYNCDGSKINYIKYLEKEEALIIKSKVGEEKIPTEGLRKVER